MVVMEEADRQRFLETLRSDEAFRATVRRDLLTQELLELPQAVAGMQVNMVEMRSDIADMQRQMVEMRSDIADMQRQMVESQRQIAELQEEVRSIRADMRTLIEMMHR